MDYKINTEIEIDVPLKLFALFNDFMETIQEDEFPDIDNNDVVNLLLDKELIVDGTTIILNTIGGDE